MKLLRIRVEQLRQFRGPLEINELAPGINVFAGPNESGKSTVVQAIRAAFFERYKSGTVGDLQPWGDTSAAPTVQLEFEWGGQRWKLSKRFLKQKRCDLEIDGRLFSGEQAEDKLAGLLGYQFAARGSSKPEHWGIPGLLWIAQGSGQEIGESVAYAGSYLQSALGETLGEVASSAGDALIAQVEQARAELLTSAGKPRGDYARVTQRHAECVQQLEKLDADIEAYRQQVDRLRELRESRAADAASPWEAYRRQAREAQARLTEVQSWEQAQQREEGELAHCAQSLELCAEQLQGFARRREELAQRARAQEAAQRSLAGIQAAGEPAAARLAGARTDYRAAEQALRQARVQARRNEWVRELEHLDVALAEDRDRLERARALQARWLEARGRVEANPVDASVLKRVRALDADLRELDAASRAVATRLSFSLVPDCRMRLGEETLQGEGERLLLDPVDLRIEGVGRLRIRPGGQDVADLARRRETVADELAGLLSGWRVRDLAQAEQMAEARRNEEEDARRAAVERDSLAPKGVDELAGRLALAAQRREGLARELSGLPDDAVGVTVEAAEGELAAARERLTTVEQEASRLERDLELARQAVAAAQAEWRRLDDAIQAPGQDRREQALQAQLLESRARETALRDSLAQRRTRIDAAHPEMLRQDIERWSTTADIEEKAARERSLELASLQSRLEAVGAHGLEEARAELASEADFLERRRNELVRRAEALEMLLGLLRTKRRDLTERIQAPLQRHLNHYLRLLFPQAELRVNEDLVPQQLVRGDPGGQSHHDFVDLSFGAREQLGLVSRLAYADLLLEAGRPTLIILDDALVHSDSQRLGHMKRMLFDAAQRHQVLLFTCHPDHWRDMGVAVVEMRSLKRQGVA